MVTEFAEIEIIPGKEQDFIAGVEANRAVFTRAAGCHGAELHRSIEAPQHFVLNVRWDSIDAHGNFWSSPDSHAWRGNISAYFAGAPKVWHSETVMS